MGKAKPRPASDAETSTAVTELKHRIAGRSIRALASHLHKFDSTFPKRRFERLANAGLDELELKARIIHVAAALNSCLPEEFAQAAALIRGANTLLLKSNKDAGDNSAFVFWPLCTFVELYGLKAPAEALRTMHGLTQLASCEFALRPYLENDASSVFAQLARWAQDKNVHVRRLASEGPRPRLPWGPRLRALQKDPSPCIKVLDTLFDDDELYVRRSVANHLNDISKDHVEVAVATAARWKKQNGSSQVEWLIRHALRGLVKAGHKGALAVLGVQRPQVDVQWQLSPARLHFGDALNLELTLRGNATQELIVDYAVHHMKANGTLTPKVFKWTRQPIEKGANIALKKKHVIRAITTRRYHAGLHRVELLVNGRSFGFKDFELTNVPTTV